MTTDLAQLSGRQAQERATAEPRKTLAQLHQPSDGSPVEFWCRRMSLPGVPGAGIRGWYRRGLFWSHDNADHYALGEVVRWVLRAA